MKKELVNLGINPEKILMRDGSGISHVNLVSPNQITQLLFAVQRQQWFSSFLESLPVAGGRDRLDRGTLYSRLSQTEASGKVRAKTGTITSVSTLSGYVDTNRGILLYSQSCSIMF
ncbi:D-alanyl-D-alanine carboxypeptidase [Halalkalibacter wakoensis JCM 9140]|uniref:D-alanyl-D-alanine carboxypeptidase n=1 Tax=Halalkalibacter wakoensis JCM 9140 TaxID=1236970 RepID=W4PZ80_9BACI|nr:D-alanyl-D-alanine carboxypeptidase [Halalkalibacter wakoensis JCM 9140]